MTVRQQRLFVLFVMFGSVFGAFLYLFYLL